MKHNLRLFKIAKLAKEKGFKTKTVTTGFTNDYLLGGKNVMINNTCILLWMSELQKWLREKHQIIVDVSLDFFNSYTKESIKYFPTFYTYSNNKKRFWIYTDYINSDECTKKMQEEMPIFQNYSTYEEALEIGLQEALKLIK